MRYCSKLNIQYFEHRQNVDLIIISNLLSIFNCYILLHELKTYFSLIVIRHIWVQYRYFRRDNSRPPEDDGGRTHIRNPNMRSSTFQKILFEDLWLIDVSSVIDKSNPLQLKKTRLTRASSARGRSNTSISRLSIIVAKSTDNTNESGIFSPVWSMRWMTSRYTFSGETML